MKKCLKAKKRKSQEGKNFYNREKFSFVERTSLQNNNNIMINKKFQPEFNSSNSTTASEEEIFFLKFKNKFVVVFNGEKLLEGNEIKKSKNKENTKFAIANFKIGPNLKDLPLPSFF